MLLAGNGRFDFDVVGESHYQSNLASFAGPKRVDGCALECLAALLCYDTNPYDPKAVAVFIARQDGSVKLVGHFSRADARRYRRALAHGGWKEDPEGMLCRALIVGGWSDTGEGEGSYGVKLDLVLPLQFRTAAAWKNWSRRLL